MKRRIIKMGAISYAKMIRLLMDGTMTCAEIAEETGLHLLTVYQYTRELHREGVIHIALWEKDSRGRDAIKVYRFGEGKDAKRYAMTQRERAARYREKKAGLAFINRVSGGVGVRL